MSRRVLFRRVSQNTCGHRPRAKDTRQHRKSWTDVFTQQFLEHIFCGLGGHLAPCGVAVQSPYAAPEHRPLLRIHAPAAFGLLPSKRLWEKARRVAHRRCATFPRDRSRVGTRGSQSRGAQEQRGIGGSAFDAQGCTNAWPAQGCAVGTGLSSISLREQRKVVQGAGAEPPAISCKLFRIAAEGGSRPGFLLPQE
jgi:hypothetical protein